MIIQNSWGQVRDGKRNTNTFQYEGCGCEGNFNLRIFNGQNSFEIPDDDEWEKGAVTVANLNGDNGGNEIDLMKLIIEFSGEGVPDCPFNLELVGNAQLWQSEERTGLITNYSMNINQLPLTVWVEVTDKSQSLRDIEIYLKKDGEVKDKVRATGLWCNFVDKHNTGRNPEIRDVADPPLSDNAYDAQSSNGDLYGLGYFNSRNRFSYGGRILVEFQLRPEGVESIWPIYFDVSRRKTSVRQGMTSGQNAFSVLESSSPPGHPDEPNDDEGDGDEDNTPPVLFGFDGPNEPVNPSLPPSSNSYAYITYNGDFEEYVRMSFDPIPVGYNDVFGSRCSDKVPWTHNRCLKLWSDDPNDPYYPPNQRYQVLDGSATYSMPTRSMGDGNGLVTIRLLSGAITEGYTILFNDDGSADLFTETNFVNSSNKNNLNQWYLTDINKIEILIQDNLSNRYLPMDELRFNVLVDNIIFNNINIE